MNQEVLFKALHRHLKFRNPNHLLKIPSNFLPGPEQSQAAEKYLAGLYEKGISWTHPGHFHYPAQFLKMKEPPLFLEYKGEPFWQSHPCLAVVGARKIHTLSENWMNQQLGHYLKMQDVCIVSGGAYGVDQQAHLLSVKNEKPTIVIVPSGLIDLYPKNLTQVFKFLNPELVTFLSEFENHQVLHKSHFFYRNRLIAALGEMTLIIQAEIKSGSLLTVHHALENGRPVLTLPAHPSLTGFSGNIKLLQDGAYLISSSLDLLEFWNGEIRSSKCQFNLS